MTTAKRTPHPLNRRPSLAGLMWALQQIGAAVSNDDREAYLTAAQCARHIGCTEEQIADAYRSRARRTPHLHFQIDGSPRPPKGWNS
ncbi:hypothetical protein [Rhodococcus jostii]|uniref:Uncharacterized protein n=1 Tax=Rhodococcus jostii TaxID=132919 RepID=A0A1H5MJG9_RHOJO|nr:hypothetical protein [Rhodococcus jostii]SEE89250.1 hypothetical protein SAMN04490220_9034 [Rhodococcus jostii]